jgi:broad specificity phosphatase PhoE
MRLIIVRHGETNENVGNIIQGQKYGTLSERGKEQVKSVSERLKSEKIDVIISSDLERTKDTSLIIAKNQPGVPVEYDALLREKSLTTFEGKIVAEYQVDRKKSGLPKHLYRTPGGENYVDLCERSKKFLNHILPKYNGKTVLVVSHGGMIKALLSVALNEPIEQAVNYIVPNTAVTILEIKRDHHFEAKLLNSIDHVTGDTIISDEDLEEDI